MLCRWRFGAVLRDRRPTLLVIRRPALQLPRSMQVQSCRRHRGINVAEWLPIFPDLRAERASTIVESGGGVREIHRDSDWYLYRPTVAEPSTGRHWFRHPSRLNGKWVVNRRFCVEVAFVLLRVTTQLETLSAVSRNYVQLSRQVLFIASFDITNTSVSMFLVQLIHLSRLPFSSPNINDFFQSFYAWWWYV